MKEQVTRKEPLEPSYNPEAMVCHYQEKISKSYQTILVFLESLPYSVSYNSFQLLVVKVSQPFPSKHHTTLESVSRSSKGHVNDSGPSGGIMIFLPNQSS